jgi:OmpA-like transmembrane domain
VSSEIDEVDAGFSATAGYRINRYLAAELTYADFGEYERIDRFSGFDDIRYELGVHGLSVSLLGSLPLDERWELFVRGGVLFSDQEVNAPSLDQTYSDEVVIAGAGVQWSFASRWATRLEYQRTGDMKYDNTGESSIDQASLSVLFKL